MGDEKNTDPQFMDYPSGLPKLMDYPKTDWKEKITPDSYIFFEQLYFTKIISKWTWQDVCGFWWPCALNFPLTNNEKCVCANRLDNIREKVCFCKALRGFVFCEGSESQLHIVPASHTLLPNLKCSPHAFLVLSVFFFFNFAFYFFFVVFPIPPLCCEDFFPWSLWSYSCFFFVLFFLL